MEILIVAILALLLLIIVVRSILCTRAKPTFDLNATDSVEDHWKELVAEFEKRVEPPKTRRATSKRKS